MSKIKKISFLVLMISVLFLNSNVRAGVANKPGGTVTTNVTVSQSYQLCYEMRIEELGNNTLDPHLTTNADWGAAAYLGASVYGSVRSKEGTAVTINGTSYNSTTNNITGIMNMGKNYTQTASLISGYTDNTNITKLKENINTKYVETLGTTATDASNKGRALGETTGWFSGRSSYPTSAYPVGVRSEFLGYYSSYNYAWYGNGSNWTNNTYRPVIWN